MRLTFVRSGGFAAAPGLRVEASVTIDAATREVVADPDYRRTLDPEESAALAEDAERLLRAGRLSPSSPEARDSFRFQLIIDDASGASAAVEWCDPASSAPPALARLIQWVAREADAIVRARGRR
jgi:hypothetical protein